MTQSIASFPFALKKEKLSKSFFIFAISLIVYQLYQSRTDSLMIDLTAASITMAALLPAYLWCNGKVKGIPVFPILMLQYVWSYALPLTNNHYRAVEYSVEQRVFAGIVVSSFLLLATCAWFRYAKARSKPLIAYRGFLESKRNTNLLLCFLLLSVVFNAAIVGGWVSTASGVFSVFRILISALSALSVYILAYQLGERKLRRFQAQSFIVLISGFTLVALASLFLVVAASVFFVATFGFIIGRKKFPIVLISVFITLFAFLHLGKADMRAEYWYANSHETVQPWEYPVFFQKWADRSFNQLGFSNDDSSVVSSDGESFFERASMVQMLLLVQSKTPAQVPYLHGKTYAVIPQLLVPRILNRKKVSVHIATHMLSVYYGLQKPNRVTNTITWGLLPESYANFGLWGCGGLAIILGSVYGLIARWSIDAPIFSFQSFLSIIMLSIGIQTEASAGVWISTLWQSVVVLLVIRTFLMRDRKVDSFSGIPGML